MPTWEELILRASAPLPSPADAAEPGERKHGWQFYISNRREHVARNILLSTMPRSSQARLRSSSGIHSSDWLLAIPTEEITTLDDATFQCAVAKRLGFHILSTEVYCEGCGHRMHASGYHRMNCMRTGRVQYRHKPLVNLWVRILSEAGVAVPKRSDGWVLGGGLPATREARPLVPGAARALPGAGPHAR